MQKVKSFVCNPQIVFNYKKLLQTKSSDLFREAFKAQIDLIKTNIVKKQ